jgi:hypothetical protein
MKEAFDIKKKWSDEALGLIAMCNDILIDYGDMGLDLTVRQLYYQLVSKDVIENNMQSYKKMATLISDARMSGLLDWDMIVDRGRQVERITTWREPHEIIQSCSYAFKIDKWETQPLNVFIMCEKQALEGVFIPIAKKWGVPYLSNKGYCSQTVLYNLGKEIARAWQMENKETKILYFGDHDPSGLDMDRDLKDRLSIFSNGTPLDVKRLSLTWDQIEEFKPPPNPAKLSDSRSSSYIKKHGVSSWELDAMNPIYLQETVNKAIEDLVDGYRWEEAEDLQYEMKKELDGLLSGMKRW